MIETILISALNLLLVLWLLIGLPPLGLLLLLFWGASVGGAAAYHFSKKRAFAVLAKIGFAPFFPIGLIGMYGVQKMVNRHLLESLTTETAGREYPYNRGYVRGYLVLGIIGLLIGIVQHIALNSGAGLAGVIGMTLLIMFWLYRKSWVVRVYPDYWVVQPGPLSTVKIVPLADVERVEIGKKEGRMWLSGTEKPIRIAWNLLDEESRRDIQKEMAHL